MKKNKKIPSLVVIVILTVITVIFWIGLEVHKALTTKPSVSVPLEITAPLDPNLNQEYLNELPNRIYLEAGTGTTQIAGSPSPSPSPEASPSASPSATVLGSPVPTSTPTPSP